MTFCLTTRYGVPISPMREFQSRQAAASAARAVKATFDVVRVIPTHEARQALAGTKHRSKNEPREAIND